MPYIYDRRAGHSLTEPEVAQILSREFKLEQGHDFRVHRGAFVNVRIGAGHFADALTHRLQGSGWEVVNRRTVFGGAEVVDLIPGN